MKVLYESLDSCNTCAVKTMASTEENEVYESWEDLEDTGSLDRKIKILQVKPTVEMPAQSNGGVVILQDESLRSHYGPAEPMVKILKRPARTCESNQVNGDSRPRQFKTLQQREQEYAEARLRILGEAHSPEETVTSSPCPTAEGVNRLQSKLEVLKTSDQDNLVRGKAVGGETTRPNKGQGGPVEAENNAVRAPKGPDGTKGFSRR